jgi:hypothetical protein
VPYIDLKDFEKDAAALLVQTGSEEAASAFIQMVQENYEGYTKKEILQAKEGRQAMGIIENASEGNFKGMVSINMITNRPITSIDIANTRTIFGPNLASFERKRVRQALRETK